MAGERRRLRFRQCDVERAIRAARATGAGRVTVREDGNIVIDLGPVEDQPKVEDEQPDSEKVSVLW